MKLQTKAFTMTVALALGAAGVVFAPGAAVAASGSAAQRASGGAPKVIRIHSNDHKITVSDKTFRPGVTEFRVTKTVHKGSSPVIFKSKNLDKGFKKLNKAFAGGAGSADAMAAFDRLVTLYGGGNKGSRWQVNLNHGSNYYAFDFKTGKLTPFTVKGDRRSAKMHHADSKAWATKDNQFETDGKLTGNWISFENKSREIHFMEADHVTKDTTNRDVTKSLKSPGKPKYIRQGGFFFDVQSPGVRTVHYQKIKYSKYLLICFMPSEMQDGTPHAFMGMHTVVNGS